MPLKSSAVQPSLTRKGFVATNSKDLMFRHYFQGRATGSWTKISLGAAHDISDSLIGLMKKQLRLRTSKEVRDLCECPMSADQYIAILREQGHLPR